MRISLDLKFFCSYLWEFVHIFSKRSANELRHIYRYATKRRAKKQLKESNDETKQYSLSNDGEKDVVLSTNLSPKHGKSMNCKAYFSGGGHGSRYFDNVDEFQTNERTKGFINQRKRIHTVSSLDERDDHIHDHMSQSLCKRGRTTLNSDWTLSSGGNYKRDK